MTADFANPLAGRLTAEAVRHLEQQGEALPGSEQVETLIATRNQGIEQRIVQRARQLSAEAGIDAEMNRVRRYAKALGYGAGLFTFLLGCLATLQAFDQGAAQVNFYWLLLVLLGFNFLALGFWLVGLWASSTPAAGILGKSAAWLLNRCLASTTPPNSNTLPIARAWLGVMLGGAQGRWALSSLSHALWASYLLGGLAMILILLSARQYDFVWETTLLGEDTFLALTHGLAWLPNQLGVHTPDAELVRQSRLGASPAVSASARQAWAGLLMSSLLLYGILPRLVLCGVCRLLQRAALTAFQLDTSQPYYVRLRQRLIPTATTTGVIDPDREAKGTAANVDTATTSQQVPAQAAWLGIELGPDLRWPPSPAASGADLGRVENRQDQHRAIQQATELGPVALAIALPLQRSPDRGLARFIASLLAAHKPCWLVLLEPAMAMPDEQRDARLVDWYALAARCGIEADHIVQLDISAGSEPHG